MICPRSNLKGFIPFELLRQGEARTGKCGLSSGHTFWQRQKEVDGGDFFALYVLQAKSRNSNHCIRKKIQPLAALHAVNAQTV